MDYTLVVILLAHLANAQTPIELNWSSETYGPDGPWHAVNISIGSNEQVVALYPGSLRNFQVLSSAMCDGIPAGQTCFPQIAGTYNENTSTTARPDDIIPFIQGLSWDAPIPSHQNYTEVFDQVLLGYVNEQPLVNQSVWAMDNADLILPNGTRYQPTVGLFSYGSPPYNSSTGELIDDPKGGNPPTQLYARGLIPSASFGLHYGSVTPFIPPSLFFGGYDRSRTLGTVSGQQYLLFGQGELGKGPVKLQIDLEDIALGVAHGGSPFSAPSISGLLASGNSSITSAVSVRPGGNTPYIHLPQSTCDAIAAELPVTFHPDLGLYLWNVDDPQYKRIVTSPSYLAFRFRTQSNPEHFEIKVPFMLLNLSLTPPLMHEPTPYFPCSPLSYDVYVLGRAFLQAAFLGANWQPADPGSEGAGYWWLAQAPGPNTNINPTITSIYNDTTNLESDSSTWESTWAGFWTPLPEPDNGLSTGAQAGIGVGVSIAGLLLIAGIVFFFCSRRRKQKQNSRRGTVASSHVSESQLKEEQEEEAIASPSSAAESPPAATTVKERNEWLHEMEESSSPRAELGAVTAKHEMFAGQDGQGPGVGERLNPAEVGARDEVFVRHELPASDHRTPEPSSSPVELDGGSYGSVTKQRIKGAGESSKGKEPLWPLPDGPPDHQSNEGSFGPPSPSEPSPPEPMEEGEKRKLWRRYNGAG